MQSFKSESIDSIFVISAGIYDVELNNKLLDFGINPNPGNEELYIRINKIDDLPRFIIVGSIDRSFKIHRWQPKVYPEDVIDLQSCHLNQYILAKSMIGYLSDNEINNMIDASADDHSERNQLKRKLQFYISWTYMFELNDANSYKVFIIEDS